MCLQVKVVQQKFFEGIESYLFGIIEGTNAELRGREFQDLKNHLIFQDIATSVLLSRKLYGDLGCVWHWRHAVVRE